MMGKCPNFGFSRLQNKNSARFLLLQAMPFGSETGRPNNRSEAVIEQETQEKASERGSAPKQGCPGRHPCEGRTNNRRMYVTH